MWEHFLTTEQGFHSPLHDKEHHLLWAGTPSAEAIPGQSLSGPRRGPYWCLKKAISLFFFKMGYSPEFLTLFLFWSQQKESMLQTSEFESVEVSPLVFARALETQ